MKTNLLALVLGSVAAAMGGAANAVTFTYLGPAYCLSLAVSSTGVITCNPTTADKSVFFFSAPLACTDGLSISTTKPGTVSCATTLLPKCTLSATPATVAPGDSVDLKATDCSNTPTPTGYQWKASAGLPVISDNTATVKVTVPPTAVPGVYSYSVTASNANGVGSVASALVKVGDVNQKGMRAFIAHQPGPKPALGDVSMVDTSSGTVVPNTIPTKGYYPTGVAVNTLGTLAYVTNSDSGTVSVIDTATNVATPIVVGDGPLGVAINSAGTRVYVANSVGNSVSVIDATSNKVIGAPLKVGNRPSGVAINQAGTRLYVTNNGDGTVSEINITNDENAVIGTPLKVGSKPFGLAVVGSRVFVANSADSNISVIDTTKSPFDASYVPVTVPVGSNPVSLDANPAGDTVYVVNKGDGTVSVISNVATPAVTDTIWVGELHDYSSVAFNPTGSLAYVTKYDNTVTVIDVAAGSASLPVIPVPGGSLNAFGKFIAIPTAINPGMWWNDKESGWGMSMAQRSGIIFGAFYTYDSAGLPTWYTMSNCTLTGVTCTGDIYRIPSGTPSTAPTWKGMENPQRVGSGTVTLADANTGTFAFTIEGQPSGFKQIKRFAFPTGTAPQTINYTDLWWNPLESGWGVALTHEYATMAVAWYSYDLAGKTTWYVASCQVMDKDCSGTLYQVTGGAPMTSEWKATNPPTEVGTISFAFTDANNGTMNYTINGVAGSKIITRY